MTQVRLTDGTLRVGSNDIVSVAGTLLQGSVEGDLSIASGASNRAVRIGTNKAGAAVAVIDAAGLSVNGVRICADASNITSGTLPVARGGTGSATASGTGSVALQRAPYLSDATLSNAIFRGVFGALLSNPVCVGADMSFIVTSNDTSVSFDAARFNSRAGVLDTSRGGTGVSTSTGTGAVVRNQAPYLSNATLSNAFFTSPAVHNGATVSNAVMYGTTLCNLALTASSYMALNASVVAGGAVGVAQGGTGVTTSTGSGSVALNRSPYLSNATLSNAALGGVTYNATFSNVSLSGVTISNLSIASASTSVTIDGSRIASGTVGAAYLPAGSTAAAGVVQLADGVASTSTTLAATANSVKTAYDRAANSGASNFVQKAGDAVTGSLILGSNLTLSNAFITGYVPTPLTFFEEFTFTPSFSAPGASWLNINNGYAASTANWKLVRMGTSVLATIPRTSFQLAGTTSSINTTTVPARFQPAGSNLSFYTPVWQVYYNLGVLNVQYDVAAQTFRFYSTTTFGNWDGGSGTEYHVFGTTIAYSTVYPG